MSSTRRLFLKRAAGSAALISCPALLGGCKGEGPSGPIPGGNVADYAVGDLVALIGEGVAIGMDEDGLYALSTICTHAGCDIGDDGTVDGTNGLECGCHGSTFDPNGAVTGGPANDDLDHFAVEVDDAGEITIDADSVVDAGERTPVATTTGSGTTSGG